MSATELRLISWNIAGRVKTNPQQMAALRDNSQRTKVVA